MQANLAFPDFENSVENPSMGCLHKRGKMIRLAQAIFLLDMVPGKVIQLIRYFSYSIFTENQTGRNVGKHICTLVQFSIL